MLCKFRFVKFSSISIGQEASLALKSSVNSDLYIFYHTFIFPTITYFSPHPLRKLIFRHYILSFPLSHHTSSGITQITFLNAPSKSPYKQMQSLTRNNHITSNHLSSLASIPSKHISAITFFSKPPFHTHLQPHSCKKIGRVTKSATLPYTFYIFEVLIFSFVVWFTRIYPICPVYLLQQNHPHKLMRKCHF